MYDHYVDHASVCDVIIILHVFNALFLKFDYVIEIC